jgi:phage tail sheath protein FI
VNGLSQQLTDAENQELAARGINALRFFPGRGNLVWGARTTAVQSMDWKYVNVRRLLIFIEQSIQDGTQWAVFEPNGPSLWAQLRQPVNNFLQTLWRAGGLTGSKPSDAFLVHCDQSTMTQADIDNGRLIMDISVAPVKPAEFVIFRIGMQVQCPTC